MIVPFMGMWHASSTWESGYPGEPGMDLIGEIEGDPFYDKSRMNVEYIKVGMIKN